MRSLALLCFAFVSAAFAAGSGIVPAQDVPAGKLPADVTPLGYTLKLKIDPRQDRFSGETRIRIKLGKAASHLWLHGNQLDVTRAELIDAAGKNHKVEYAQRNPDGVAEVKFDGSLPAQNIELILAYTAAFNAQLEGLYKVKVRDDAYAITQMEAVSARNAFPGFDEPRFKTPFDLTLTVPKDEVVVANTLPKHEEASGDGAWKTVTYATTKPLPTYLVAFAVGPWDVVDAPPIAANAVRKNPVPLRAIGPRGSASQLKWILDETPGIVKFYEEYTNVAYPFDKLDLLGAPDFAAGAMENAGLIVFRDALLRLDAHSPAASYRSSFNVTSHEVAHQWFGDLVTVPWWDDIWLNEAFATWAQGKETVALKPEYQGDLSRLEGTLGAMENDSLLSARKIRQPIHSRGDIETAFDGITYQKGAAVLRMFEEWLGEDTYRKAMREYLRRHAFGSGNSDDLIAMIAEVSGKGEILTGAMRGFLDQSGIPLVHTDLSCKEGKAKIEQKQSRYLPFGVMSKDTSSWQVPVCTRFGHAGMSSTQCFLLDKAQREFDVDGGCPDWYLPNANATGYYRFLMPATDFAALNRAIDKLDGPEKLIYADAVSSALLRGDASPVTVLDAMPVLAGSDMPQVATALLKSFEWIREHLAGTVTRAALDAFAEKLYTPRLQALGFHRKDGEEPATTQLRVRLADFLALVVRDPAVRKALSDQGRAALGLDGSGKADLSRADPDLLGTALKVAVQESGGPAFEAARAELKVNHETQQHYQLLGALGATLDAKLGAQALDYGLTPAVQVGEMSSLYGAHMSQPENRPAFWVWFKAHFDTFRDRLPPGRQSVLPKIAATGRCSGAQADELQGWFAPRIEHLIGGDRGLAQALEGVNQCSSLREHVGEKALTEWSEEHHPN